MRGLSRYFRAILPACIIISGLAVLFCDLSLDNPPFGGLIVVGGVMLLYASMQLDTGSGE